MSEKIKRSATCATCGCTHNILEGEESFFECEYCGNINAVSNVDLNPDEEIILDNIKGLRFNYNFKEAQELIKPLLNKHPKNTNILFEDICCRYGIIFVDDPLDGKKKPIMVLDNPNIIEDDPIYKNLISLTNNSNLNDKNFKKTLNIIIENQKTFKKIKGKENNYDVFFSFKTRNDYNRDITPDYYLAEKLYYLSEKHEDLKSKNLNIFFSPISLQSHQGEYYDSYIQNALMSAKVLVIFCSDPDYLRSSWVKSEWERFLCYKNSNIDKERFILLVNIETVNNEIDNNEYPSKLLEIQNNTRVDYRKKEFSNDDINTVLSKIGLFFKEKKKQESTNPIQENSQKSELILKIDSFIENLNIVQKTGNNSKIEKLVDEGFTNYSSSPYFRFRYGLWKNNLNFVLEYNDLNSEANDDIFKNKSNDIILNCISSNTYINKIDVNGKKYVDYFPFNDQLYDGFASLYKDNKFLNAIQKKEGFRQLLYLNKNNAHLYFNKINENGIVSKPLENLINKDEDLIYALKKADEFTKSYILKFKERYDAIRDFQIKRFLIVFNLKVDETFYGFVEEFFSYYVKYLSEQCDTYLDCYRWLLDYKSPYFYKRTIELYINHLNNAKKKIDISMLEVLNMDISEEDKTKIIEIIKNIAADENLFNKRFSIYEDITKLNNSIYESIKYINKNKPYNGFENEKLLKTLCQIGLNESSTIDDLKDFYNNYLTSSFDNSYDFTSNIDAFKNGIDLLKKYVINFDFKEIDGKINLLQEINKSLINNVDNLFKTYIKNDVKLEYDYLNTLIASCKEKILIDCLNNEEYKIDKNYNNINNFINIVSYQYSILRFNNIELNDIDIYSLKQSYDILKEILNFVDSNKTNLLNIGKKDNKKYFDYKNDIFNNTNSFIQYIIEYKRDVIEDEITNLTSKWKEYYKSYLNKVVKNPPHIEKEINTIKTYIKNFEDLSNYCISNYGLDYSQSIKDLNDKLEILNNNVGEDQTKYKKNIKKVTISNIVYKILIIVYVVVCLSSLFYFFNSFSYKFYFSEMKIWPIYLLGFAMSILCCIAYWFYQSKRKFNIGLMLSLIFFVFTIIGSCAFTFYTKYSFELPGYGQMFGIPCFILLIVYIVNVIFRSIIKHKFDICLIMLLLEIMMLSFYLIGFYL